MNYDLLRKHGEHRSPLQSWYAELETYTSLSFRPRGSEHCDETITKPTIFIKLDAGGCGYECSVHPLVQLPDVHT